MKIKLSLLIIFINFFLVLPFFNPVRAILEEGCNQESYKQENADRVVIGTVGETNCTEKVCLTSVQVEENLKGTGAQKIFIETPGSNIPVPLSESTDVWVEDNPTFTEGERAKFYLKSTEKPNTYTLVCAFLGKEALDENKPLLQPSESPETKIPVFETLPKFFTRILNWLKGIFRPKIKTPLTWEECLKNPKSKIQPTYPSVCVYPDGRSVTQP